MAQQMENEKQSAKDVQIGGDHYKLMKIQPIEFIQANRAVIGFEEGNIIKYICRHRHKNGKQDLEKVIHYCQLLIESEYGND